MGSQAEPWRIKDRALVVLARSIAAEA